MEYTKGLCSCGNPQSYPIPHEHDRTEREKQIIAHYEDTNADLYEALKAIVEDDDGLSPELDAAREALAKANEV